MRKSKNMQSQVFACYRNECGHQGKPDQLGHLEELRSHQDYRTDLQIQRQEREVKVAKKVLRSFEKVISHSKPYEVYRNPCLVCSQCPGQVFDCGKCNNWICGQCASSELNCPICHQDLEEMPMERNKALELFMHHLN